MAINIQEIVEDMKIPGDFKENQFINSQNISKISFATPDNPS